MQTIKREAGSTMTPSTCMYVSAFSLVPLAPQILRLLLLTILTYLPSLNRQNVIRKTYPTLLPSSHADYRPDPDAPVPEIPQHSSARKPARKVASMVDVKKRLDKVVHKKDNTLVPSFSSFGVDVFARKLTGSIHSVWIQWASAGRYVPRAARSSRLGGLLQGHQEPDELRHHLREPSLLLILPLFRFAYIMSELTIIFLLAFKPTAKAQAQGVRLSRRARRRCRPDL
jgi:hypothetical protein